MHLDISIWWNAMFFFECGNAVYMQSYWPESLIVENCIAPQCNIHSLIGAVLNAEFPHQFHIKGYKWAAT